MQDPLSAEGRISLLNVGTKILLKDVMDQYVRTLGDYKTHYAGTMASAQRAFSENTIHVVITEVDLEDGSAYRLIQNLGGVGTDDDLYVILALPERNEELMALAAELEVHSVLIKPFAATELKAQIEKYRAWRVLPKQPWEAMIREAKMAHRDKRFRECENFYKEAIKAAPNNPVPIYKTAQYYMTKPDYGIVETLLKKAIELNPNYTQAISLMGSMNLARGDLEKAEENFRRAHTISPLNPDRMVDMVRLSINRAIDTCKASLRLDPGNLQAKFTLGKLLATQKDYVGTVRELEKIVHQLKDSQKNEAQTFVALARKLGGLAK